MTCTLCPLGENVITNCVPGRGPLRALGVNPSIMIVGEAPGSREDFIGEPFVGPAGQYLDHMLRDAGLDPAELYLTNAVKCRPPVVAGKQTPPEQFSIDACRTHLRDEIHRVRPEAIIALGAVALKSLTKLGGIMSKRGQSFPLHKDFGYACEVFASLHPSYVMRVPQARRGVVSDLQRVRDRHKPEEIVDWKWWSNEYDLTAK
jgi:DNA polymerase